MESTYSSPKQPTTPAIEALLRKLKKVITKEVPVISHKSPSEAITSPETTVEKTGIFEVAEGSPIAMDFAKYLSEEHALHKDSHESASTEGKVDVREATPKEFAAISEHFMEGFSAAHAARFGAKINGILFFEGAEEASIDGYTSPWPDLGNEESLPDGVQLMGWHGTSASRAVEILANGFKVTEKQKSGNPMYGTGIYFAEDSSKSMGYFHPGYYNDSEAYKQGGVMLLVKPKVDNNSVHIAKDALWSNTITKDGTQVDWRDHHDAVFALSRKDSGSSISRPNFREMCVKKPEDVEIIGAVWVELIPGGSSDHDQAEPVIISEPVVAAPEIVKSKEIETTPLAEALDLLPIDEQFNILRMPEATDEANCYYEFNLPDHAGLELRRGDSVVVSLPDSAKGRKLDQLTLRHRKDRKHNGSVRKNITDENGVFREISDTEGAYTKIFVFDENTKSWVFWPDPYKRKDDKNYGAKYAEPRSPYSPEVECLYDWKRLGDVSPSHIVAMGWGQGKNAVTNFHGLDLDVFPEEEFSSLQEHVFSPGTSFVNEGMVEPRYGGRPGRYPNSVKLDMFSSKDISGNEGCSLKNGKLHVVIQEDMTLSRLEVACGDTHPDGALGWAKLSAEVVKDGVSEKLMTNLNVPPQGVLKGSPKEPVSLKKGDEVIISGASDPHLYLMGVRLQ